MPGSFSSSSTDAVFMLRGVAGGCFCAVAVPRQVNECDGCHDRRAADSRVTRTELEATRMSAKCELLIRGTGRGPTLLMLLAMGIVLCHRPEKRGLRRELLAVTYEHDLGVGRIKVEPRREQNIVRGERPDFFAIGFEVVVGQLVEADGRKLAEDAVLRSNSERENSAEVTLRAFEFF